MYQFGGCWLTQELKQICGLTTMEQMVALLRKELTVHQNVANCLGTKVAGAAIILGRFLAWVM